ncbi:oxidoreductase [Gemmobacter tilapiae]|uniref:Oxidoreductase n=2 Tax=Neogemmobacter tilapiae TaxID=875041 RepID=A0A918TWU9_9RHOB|nr:oxidoreductase [Gemmobacter tilapiae]
MGAGIFGLSIAWELAQRGAKVRVVEVARPGAGSSGGLVGAMQPHVPEQWNDKKQFQLESLLMAQAWWQAVEAAGGQSSGYARLGRLQAVSDEVGLELAQRRAESARELWQGQAVWQLVRATGGWEPPSPSGWLIRDTLSARLHPRMALTALLAALASKCIQVEDGDSPGDGTVIWATGVDGLRAMGQGDGVKGQALSLALDQRRLPQIYADGLHIVPHADGTIGIGSTSERTWENAHSTDGQLDAMHQKAIALLPVLAKAPLLHRWAGLRPRAKSRAPLLGPWPGRPGHFVANGGFKIGFGVAPKIATTMSELILDGFDAIPPSFHT